MKRTLLPFVVLLFVPAALADVGARCARPGRTQCAPIDMFSKESLQAVALPVIADEKTLSDSETRRPQTYRPYWMTYAWLSAATVYDVESTFYLLDQCGDCFQEQNPITKPIIDRGRLATYLFSATVNGVVMYIAKRMYDRADPWWRILPVTLAVVHVIAGTWNLYEASQPTEHPHNESR